MRKFILHTCGMIAGIGLMSACSVDTSQKTACADADPIGRFNPSTDLFLAQFDIKTDTDDLHSAAAVATFLAHPKFACVRYRAVSGTYGTQDGSFVDPENIFADAFGDSWVDAHNDRDAAVKRLAGDVAATLNTGGKVWVMEGGQSDVSAATLRLVLGSNPDAPIKNVHIVQHSDWNESVTSDDALSFVRANATYVKIPDGNVTGNGSPGFWKKDTSLWPTLLAAPNVGTVWQDVKDLALARNGSGHEDASISKGGYANKAIGAGGLDFSDTAEAMWIFGYEELHDTQAFVTEFVLPVAR